MYLATLRDEQFKSSVLGLVHGKRGYGIEVELTQQDEGAVKLDLAQPYAILASQVDALAAEGSVRVLIGSDK